VTGPVTVHCPAKVNLFLELLSRRGDGYHELVTVLQEIDLRDTLEIAAGGPGIQLAVVGADLPAGEGNLVHDAARLFLDRFAPDAEVRILLEKRIPVEAGLGGGSSDAAGTLRGLRDLLRPDLADGDLLSLAAAIGSDVPFFLRGGTALGEGRGERLTPLESPPPTWLVLFFPPFGLATAEVYAHARVPGEEERRDVRPLLDSLDDPAPHLANRLEEAAARADPRVAEVRGRLEADRGPDEALRMSGSGSAFFLWTGSLDRASALAARWNREGGGRALAVRTAPSRERLDAGAPER